MTETILCPGCSTRFALRPERVHAGTRRAKCFKCETIFDILEIVQRLLPPPPPEALPETVPTAPEAAPAQAEAAAPEPSLFAAFDGGPPPSLTLGDLEGAEDEIMEKTLVILPPPPPPEPEPEPEPEHADVFTQGGYSSAKDAISKLMGDAPAPAASQGDRRQMSARNPMDVEATLSALDSTLSGAATVPGQPLPSLTPDATASTMKLTAQEIQAAMASFSSQPKPEPPRAQVPPKPLPPPPPPVMAAPPTSQGSDLLKIQLEQETLENVTIDQVTTWIEQGRVHDYHMVARQFSEHWIEAIKVPALRPVFERKRREEIGLITELPAPPSEISSAKKSLFGGLFGRN